MEEKRFTLRMDGTLFEDISRLAVDHRRSTAKEIECAIAEYVIREKRKQIMSNYDKENASSEDAKERLAQLDALFKAYERFQ